MSENREETKTGIEKAGEDLFTFAVDRDDVKALVANLPEQADIQGVTVEYELQILKIISVGWSISYYLEKGPQKDQLAECYWQAVQQFATSISASTGLMTGHEIDYFQILKDRLDMYLDALNENPYVSQPVSIIGPEFARTCGNVDDAFTVLTGAKMFSATIGSVKEYLEAMRLR
jgi:hypothetical protein